MISQVLDLARFLLNFIVFAFYGIVFIFLAYRVIKRNRTRISFIITGFYLSCGTGVIVDLVYIIITPLIEDLILLFLYFITVFLLSMSLCFLNLFVMMLYKSERIFTTQIQLLYLFFFSILILTLFLIPNAVAINESTGWRPKWSLVFTVLFLMICTFGAIIPTYYYSIKLYQKIENKDLRKRWLCFIIGISGYFFLCYGTSYFCYFGHVNLIIWAIIAMPSLINLYLIYYGIGRQME
ncbi:MAG: hypothetical protein ACFFHV_00310 [Promethearchaeota archaeon]